MEQPRVPKGSPDGGQWTSPGALRSRGAISSRGDYATALPSTEITGGMAPTSDFNPTGRFSAAGSKLLADTEKKISSEENENSLCQDAEGKKLFTQSGNKHSVYFDDSQLEKMKNGVMTHNHPSGNSGDNTPNPFSVDDVHLATYTNLKEIRAVTANGTIYRLGRTGSSWPEGTLAKISVDFNAMVQKIVRGKFKQGGVTIRDPERAAGLGQYQNLKNLSKWAAGDIYFKTSRRKD